MQLAHPDQAIRTLTSAMTLGEFPGKHKEIKLGADTTKHILLADNQIACRL